MSSMLVRPHFIPTTVISIKTSSVASSADTGYESSAYTVGYHSKVWTRFPIELKGKCVQPLSSSVYSTAATLISVGLFQLFHESSVALGL